MVPRLATRLAGSDVLGGWAVRWGVRRMDYKVAPGLYAVGTPSDGSPVLVTANYKLTFDTLRRRLGGRDLWLLVLDTHGINVWCAAGKGTFGTRELVTRIKGSMLSQVVSHRNLVLPQLGATGVAAHEVRAMTGFRVVWGPVRAEDVPAFIDAGMKATPEMRRVTFSLRERLVLVPVELVFGAKPAAGVAAAIVVLAALVGRSFDPAALASRAGIALALLTLGVLSGAVVTPALLPWLPGRAFSAKGATAGTAIGALAAVAAGVSGLGAAALVIGTAAIASYTAMNFTGSTPFTSLSGVDREMRRWMPLQAAAAVVTLGLWVAALLTGKAA